MSSGFHPENQPGVFFRADHSRLKHTAGRKVGTRKKKLFPPPIRLSGTLGSWIFQKHPYLTRGGGGGGGGREWRFRTRWQSAGRQCRVESKCGDDDDDVTLFPVLFRPIYNIILSS